MQADRQYEPQRPTRQERGYDSADPDPDSPQLDGRPLPLARRGRFPRPLRDTIDACLEFDVATRPTLDEVAAALEAFSGTDPRRATGSKGGED